MKSFGLKNLLKNSIKCFFREHITYTYTTKVELENGNKSHLIFENLLF